MSHCYMSVGRIMRRLSTGDEEELTFDPGVNLIVGRPNTGKTKWLQTLDYLLGDPGENPLEGAESDGLFQKYKAAGAEIVVGDQRLWVERRWREPGAKTKIFVDGEGMSAPDFQHLLMGKLGIPVLHFPKGNPMSGQSWSELSFRMLLRHMYRQQRFWGGIVDQQPDSELHASLLLFLGLAERLFDSDYEQLIALKMKANALKAQRDGYSRTLDEIARDVVSNPEMIVGTNVVTVRNAQDRLAGEIQKLRHRRETLISGARDQVIPDEQRSPVQRLAEERANRVVMLEGLRQKAKANTDRLDEVCRYRDELADELERMVRAEDAGIVLADLKITHCPACDQTVRSIASDAGVCFLCHQVLPAGPVVKGLGAARVHFELDRLVGERKEADQLIEVLKRDSKRLTEEIVAVEERLRMLENQLAPARQAVGALIQEQVSEIDTALGELSERERQLGRISAALELVQSLTDRIASVEGEIEPLQRRVDDTVHATAFDTAASALEDGMNAYLDAINILRPGIWKHSPIAADFTRYGFTFRVGPRRWQAALGGTDTLYFLMAYQYGLLTLSDKPNRRYPGLSVIDLPAEFSGEAVEDKENFIVQPFIDLAAKDEYKGVQLIITGASFAGLEGPHRNHLGNVFVA